MHHRLPSHYMVAYVLSASLRDCWNFYFFNLFFSLSDLSFVLFKFFGILVKIAAMNLSETLTLAIPVLTNMSLSFKTFFILAMNSINVSFAVVHRVIKQTIKANLTTSSVEEFAFEVASFFPRDVFHHFVVPHDV